MKKKITLMNPDPFAEVRMENMKRDGQPTDKFYVAIAKPDGNFTDIPGVSAVHSEDYQLVSNQDVHDTAKAVMEATGMSFQHVPAFGNGHSNAQFWNGHRFIERWYTRDVSVDAPNGHGLFALGFQIENSYGGSSSVKFSFFGMHLLCSNQFHSSNMFSTERFPHVTNTQGGDVHQDIDWAKNKLISQANDFGNIKPKLDMLQDARVDGMQGFLDLRKRLHQETGVNTRDKQWLDELSGLGVSQELQLPMDNYGEVDTYWALASAYTAIATHAVGGVTGASQSTRVVDWMLKDAA